MKRARRDFRLMAGLCGIAGPIALVASFWMNPAPPSGLSPDALVQWAAPRVGSLLLGGWMQGIGSLLMVIFALALVELSAPNSFAARLARLAAGTILAVSLIEVTFYLAAANSVSIGDRTLALVSSGLIEAVQHVFLIAPALLIPLGFVLWRSRLIGRILALSALAIGAMLQVLGFVGIFRPIQPVVDVVLIVQAAWFGLAGIVFSVGQGDDDLERASR